MDQSRNAQQYISGRRPKREDNIKMDLREVGCDPRDWIALAEDRDQWRGNIVASHPADPGLIPGRVSFSG